MQLQRPAARQVPRARQARQALLVRQVRPALRLIPLARPVVVVAVLLSPGALAVEEVLLRREHRHPPAPRVLVLRRPQLLLVGQALPVVIPVVVLVVSQVVIWAHRR